MSPLPIEQRYKFFVYIIESPSSLDLYTGRSEGQLIQQAVKLNQIPCVLRTVANRDSFNMALSIGLSDAMKAFVGLHPVVHISAHGFDNGIQFTNGEVIKWAELRQWLLPINKALNGLLLVCMSSCKGYAGIRMAMEVHDNNYPYFALIGNSEAPTWSETAVAFTTFYHLFSNGHMLDDAVTTMRAASGSQTFYVERAEQSKQAYLNFLKKLNTPVAADRVIEEQNRQHPSELTKWLSLGKQSA
jgi:hypothetical protein